MRLHRTLGDAQLRADLLVELPGDEPVEHLPLTGGESVEPLAKLGDARPLKPLRLAPADGLVHRARESCAPTGRRSTSTAPALSARTTSESGGARPRRTTGMPSPISASRSSNSCWLCDVRVQAADDAGVMVSGGAPGTLGQGSERLHLESECLELSLRARHARGRCDRPAERWPVRNSEASCSPRLAVVSPSTRTPRAPQPIVMRHSFTRGDWTTTSLPAKTRPSFLEFRTCAARDGSDDDPSPVRRETARLYDPRPTISALSLEP